ncbi:MAG: magnesium transporter [Candidatus Aenigmatarchaeota archaeon]
MKIRIRYLKKIAKLKRKRYHPLLHKIHKEYKISRKTLLYIKEYGPRSSAIKNIIKESFSVLIFASIISSVGGLALENIKALFISIIPLIILLPALNDMIGDFGTIIAARFSTLLHEERISKKWWKDADAKKLFCQVYIAAMITAILCFVSAIVISVYSGYVDYIMATKIFFITIIDVMALVSIIFAISVVAGLYFYRKQEDPNNFLIPISTSIADFGNMLILSLLVLIFF